MAHVVRQWCVCVCVCVHVCVRVCVCEVLKNDTGGL